MREIKKGNLRFLSRHPVLDQLAADMANYVSNPIALRKNINIYVGTHKFRRIHIRKSGLNLGIQTEQLIDETGNKMWRKQKKYRTIRDIMRYNRILDLSLSNSKVYNWLPEIFKSKIDFGPFIFPTDKIAYSKGNIKKTLFYGFMNERRRQIINGIEKNTINCCAPDTFGAKLSDEIKDHMGVLNIHFNDGIYSEWPRVLSAYIHGKPIISEQLCSLFHANQDYIDLKNINKFDGYEDIFKNFQNEIARNYKLSEYIIKNF